MARVPDGIRRVLARRWVRVTGAVLAGLVLSLGVFSIGFHLACEGDAPADAPYAMPADVAAYAADVPDYRRTEESTYLTLLEWYQVFSYQEYGAYIATERPSGFPYLTSIVQSWTMYCRAYGLTEDAYPFNAGNHLMLFVIGTSFAGEYAWKGVYENTWGRLFELDGHDTPEDRFAAHVAQDYAEFIERDPWYAYPFGGKAVDLWTDHPFFGPDFARKLERRVFLTIEYGAKAGYAGAIRLATGAIYGAPPATDHLVVVAPSPSALDVEGVVRQKELAPGRWAISIPHYQGFTDAVPVLAANGVRFIDISGNDEIVLTILAPGTWAPKDVGAEALFALPVPTDPATHRHVVLAPVEDLHSVLEGARASGARVEHLFDY